MNKNIVVFKGNKDGITILLDSKSDFKDIKTVLAQKVIAARKFFGGAKTVIIFQGRILSEEEEMELMDIIANKADLEISFITNNDHKNIEMRPKESNTKQENADSHSELLANTAKKLFLPEHITKFQGGSLRSGQCIHFAGSVVVLGDINPGAEIIAEGNIIILGALKGLVHAGCTGNTECFVSAVSLQPTQLRIADIISYIPKEIELKTKRKEISASYAYIKRGQIYIAPLVDA